MGTAKKVLVGTIHLPPDEDSPTGHIYNDGDVPSAEHAKLITNPNAWREETGDEDTDLYLNSDEEMRHLLTVAKELGVEPGAGLPRNPSKELVARAIRFAEGRATEAEPPGTSKLDVDVEEERSKLDGRTREGRAAKASGSVAGS